MLCGGGDGGGASHDAADYVDWRHQYTCNRTLLATSFIWLNRNKLHTIYTIYTSVQCVDVEICEYFVAQIAINRRGCRLVRMPWREAMNKTFFGTHNSRNWNSPPIRTMLRSQNLMSHQNSGRWHSEDNVERFRMCVCVWVCGCVYSLDASESTNSINAIKTEILFQMNSNAAYGNTSSSSPFLFLSCCFLLVICQKILS